MMGQIRLTDHVNVATGQGYQINGVTIIQETADFLVITGSANGTALSGSSVNLDGNLSASVNISALRYTPLNIMETDQN